MSAAQATAFTTLIEVRVKQIFRPHLVQLCAETRKLLKKRAKIEKEREAVERDLAATPMEADIKQVMDRLKAATEASTEE